MRQKRTFLALFLGLLMALAGCTETDGSSPPEASWDATVSPGTTAHILMSFASQGGVENITFDTIDAQGLEVAPPGRLHYDEASGQAAGWVGITVPEGADEGVRDVLVRATTENGTERRFAFEIQVAEPEDPLAAGDWVLADFTLRTQDGALITTTNQSVADSPLSRSPAYEAPEAPVPQPLLVDPAALPPELATGLDGAGIGSTITFQLPEFFGGESEQQQRDREETVERQIELDRFVEVPRSIAEQQGFIDAETQEGDAIETGSPFPYVVALLNETTFRAELDVAEGERYTLHDAWPEATVVAEVNATAVTFRTQPEVGDGEAFTWQPEWPDATVITAIDEEEIHLLHTPDEGLTFTTQDARGQPVEATVVSVGQENITIEQDNPHPLAGETAWLEMTLLERTDAPDMQMPRSG